MTPDRQASRDRRAAAALLALAVLPGLLAAAAALVGADRLARAVLSGSKDRRARPARPGSRSAS